MCSTLMFGTLKLGLIDLQSAPPVPFVCTCVRVQVQFTLCTTMGLYEPATVYIGKKQIRHAPVHLFDTLWIHSSHNNYTIAKIYIFLAYLGFILYVMLELLILDQITWCHNVYHFLYFHSSDVGID